MNPLSLIMIGLGLIPIAIGFFLGYQYQPASPLYLTLIIIYFVVASITRFDTRLIQAKMQGQDFGELPGWTGFFSWAQWGLFCALAILNWRVAIGLFVLKFILKFLPVLETIGTLLMSPFKPRA
ncbi:MAG: hypothetical protein IPJ55_13895 [Chloracidobacterium sp.]|nr:hypothetical protein [Chloracidobacterium sp.]